MVTPPPGISPHAFEALIERRRSEQFLAACRLPGMWLRRAQQHMRAADILYEIAHSASQRNMARILDEPNHKGHSHGVARTLVGEELEDVHDENLLSEYLLLVGYALECVLKGYLLAIIPELVIDERRIDRLVANHDLCQLCHECAIRLSSDETRLLKLITRHIVWGKYTAPLIRSDMPSWIDPEDQEEKSLAVSNPFHERRVQVIANGVFMRAFELLAQQRQAS